MPRQHTVQESTPRFTRPLPAASVVVQACIGSDVGGDCPYSGGVPPHREALVAMQSAAQQSASESASGLGRQPGTRSPVHRMRWAEEKLVKGCGGEGPRPERTTSVDPECIG